jgi:hypothetical protein
LPQQRDFKVTALALKGKAKVPTVSLETEHGEKLSLKLDDPLHLASFEINQEFTVKISKGEQVPLFTSNHPATPLATDGKVNEAFADVPSDEEIPSESSEESSA